MDKKTFCLVENYMSTQMDDNAHDKEHVYRVLYTAIDIAATEKNVDYDVLIVACLLHDVGRKEQFENPSLCHAQVGGHKAYAFLVENGFSAEFAQRVQHCIVTHRFRKSNPPQSLEAKILFDADKIDSVGALGIARSLVYIGGIGDPLYTLDDSGKVSDGQNDDKQSFFHEYHFKLERLYSHFCTDSGRALAKSRENTAVEFYNALLKECSVPYLEGKVKLNGLLD